MGEEYAGREQLEKKAARAAMAAYDEVMKEELDQRAECKERKAKKSPGVYGVMWY